MSDIDETSPLYPIAAGNPVGCSKFQIYTDHWEVVETGNHLCCHIILVHSSTKWLPVNGSNTHPFRTGCDILMGIPNFECMHSRLSVFHTPQTFKPPIAPEKLPGHKERLVFQASFFRGYVGYFENFQLVFL